MSDLIVGVIVLAGLSGVLFALGCWLGRALSPPRVKGVGLAASVALIAYIALLSDDVRLATLLPVSNLVVVGNWVPLLLSFLAGLAWSLIPRQGPAAGRGILARRLVVVLSLEAVAWLAVARPIWGVAPRCLDRWEGDFCVQTTDSTCTPACAATLLRAHGIVATEREMAALCLTRKGTLWQGLYRGLKLKTAGTPWDVEVVRGPFEGLKSLGPGPAILAAGIPGRSRVARIYTERYGWTPGEWHSVLFFGFRGDGRVAMGDPTPGIGREDWSEDDLRVLWAGRGMRLVPRHRTTGSGGGVSHAPDNVRRPAPRGATPASDARS
jgi:hypothetical protein